MEDITMREQEVPSADQQDAFLDGWDDEQTAQETPEAEETTEDGGVTEEETESAVGGTQSAEKAVPPTEPETAAGAETQQSTEKPTDAPEKTWVLRHLDETKNVSEAEMVTLAQKGMDYDRVRAKYDESKPAMELLSIFAKQKGVSVADYVSFLRTEAKKADGLSEAEARRSIELEDREAAVSAREEAQAATQQAEERANAASAAAAQRRRADIDEFTREYPDAARNPDAIPKEVWDAVSAGSSLTVAYAKYDAQRAREEAERTRSAAQAERQNAKNAARSTGSMRSAGENTGGRDPFLEGWGD